MKLNNRRGEPAYIKAKALRSIELAAFIGPLESNTKLIPLGHDRFAKVDAKDFEWLNNWNWYLAKNGYAVRSDPSKRNNKIRMHNLLCPCSVGFTPDHANRDRSDNRRFNLRQSTQAQNLWNSIRQGPKTSRFKGVHFCRTWKRFKATCGRNNLGSFKSELEAAKAYNDCAKRERGQFAFINPV